MPLFAVNVDQLEPGDLKIERSTIPFAKLTLRRTRANVGIRATIEVSARTTLAALVADTQTPVRWSGIELRGGDMASSCSSAEVLSRGPATLYTIVVDRNVLPHEFVAFDSRVKRLRGYLEQIFNISDLYGSAAIPDSTHSSILDHLLPFRHEKTHNGKMLQGRVAAVRRCESYVLEHMDDKLTLFDLTAASGLGSRSLMNAFRTVTGYSPMAYLKLQRLNGARRELIAADRTGLRICDIAANWGFWHFGHFTADYRAMFAEKPSETLVRRPLRDTS